MLRLCITKTERAKSKVTVRYFQIFICYEIFERPTVDDMVAQVKRWFQEDIVDVRVWKALQSRTQFKICKLFPDNDGPFVIRNNYLGLGS